MVPGDDAVPGDRGDDTECLMGETLRRRIGVGDGLAPRFRRRRVVRCRRSVAPVSIDSCAARQRSRCASSSGAPGAAAARCSVAIAVAVSPRLPCTAHSPRSAANSTSAPGDAARMRVGDRLGVVEPAAQCERFDHPCLQEPHVRAICEGASETASSSKSMALLGRPRSSRRPPAPATRPPRHRRATLPGRIVGRSAGWARRRWPAPGRRHGAGHAARRAACGRTPPHGSDRGGTRADPHPRRSIRPAMPPGATRRRR